MIMKLYSNGSLERCIKRGKVNSKAIQISFMADIANGLNYMHSKHVAHYDTKPANFLVDVDSFGYLFFALTDFGISQLYSENARMVYAFQVVSLKGASIAYAAPDIVFRLRKCRPVVKIKRWRVTFTVLEWFRLRF